MQNQTNEAGAGGSHRRGSGFACAGGEPARLADLTVDDFLLALRAPDEKQRRYAEQASRPFSEVADQHCAWCVTSGRSRSAAHLKEKRRVLGLLESEGVTTLGGFSAAAVDDHTQAVLAAGLTPNTANRHFEHFRAFGAWCQETGRLEVNPLAKRKPLYQDDAKFERDAVEDDEYLNLIRVADCRDPSGYRTAWYRLGGEMGLRKSDLRRLRRCDIDFIAGRITFTRGKARRVDRLPMPATIAAALQRIIPPLMHPASDALIFPRVVTDETRRKDFERAGIRIRDKDGKPLRRRKDLHSLRTTFATRLIRAGVPLVITQRLMRHASPQTTLRHYIKLGQDDDTKAMKQALLFDQTVEQPPAIAGRVRPTAKAAVLEALGNEWSTAEEIASKAAEIFGEPVNAGSVTCYLSTFKRDGAADVRWSPTRRTANGPAREYRRRRAQSQEVA